jgi:N-acetylglucosaminyl-diphospho-decaprenol L-rhamnosyltransferase
MRLSVIIVTYASAGHVPATLAAVRAQLAPGDEVVVVDNASPDGTADLIARQAAWVRLERSPHNAGFAAGCNRGARLAAGELLLFLNPDAIPEPGALAAVKAGAARWDAFQGLLVRSGAAVVNSAGGEVQYLGLAWAGGCDEPLAGLDRSPRAVGFASGACLAVTRARFLAVGGFPERFFMYCEDVDLSLRLRLAGGRVGIEPAAVFRHDYDFAKGADKWRRLERNRWWIVLRTYPTPLLLSVLPALLGLELLLLAVAARDGWLPAKLRAMAEVGATLPRVLRERRGIQRQRAISAAAFAAGLRDVVESPYVAAASQAAPARALLRGYGALARAASRVDR